jgi:23S rRNA A1618 N6-methylase RlmF
LVTHPPIILSFQEEDDENVDDSREELNPVPAGKEGELRTKGGEVGLIAKMVGESAHLDRKIIFTCMIGHKASVKKVKTAMEEYEAPQVS